MADALSDRDNRIEKPNHPPSPAAHRGINPTPNTRRIRNIERTTLATTRVHCPRELRARRCLIDTGGECCGGSVAFGWSGRSVL
jgi:hypothetical protein